MGEQPPRREVTPWSLLEMRPRTLALLIVTIAFVAAGVIIAIALVSGPARTPPSPSASLTIAAEHSFPPLGQTALANPLGIAFDGTHIYVAESDAAAIRTFAPEGAAIRTFALPPAVGASDAYPSSIALAGEELLAVVDGAGARVVVLDLSAEATTPVLFELWRLDPSTAPMQPTAVTFGEGEYYVADGADHTIKVYESSGLFRRSLAAELDEPLTFVGDLALEGGGLYVADANSGRVIVLDPRTGAKRGQFSDQYALPRGLASLEGALIAVVDTFERAVWLCAPDGSRLEAITAEAAPALTPRAPRDAVWCPETGLLYVTDAQAGAVLVYTIKFE